jgi:hypothetical protein
MYINADLIIKLGAILAALLAIGGAIYKVIKWFQTQDRQTIDIDELRKKESEDIQEIKDEQCLLTYGVLACLKGLSEQGCDGAVTEAINEIEKHLNKQAHGQKAKKSNIAHSS